MLGQRNDIPDIMCAIDLYIMPSFSEAFPNVLSEAMLCETPCISTDVGDAKYIVGNTGWIVPIRDPIAIADAYEKAFNSWQDRKKWKNRQRNCRKHIKDNYSIEKMVVNYNKTWNEVIQERFI